MLTKYLSSILLSSLVALTGFAQQSIDIEAILTSIENNNTQLKALRQANAATIAESKAENTLGATSVEYSPFFQKGTGGIASSELIVSQEFDFPTTYSNRRKATQLQENMLNKEYLIARRDILLEAHKLCCDLVYLANNATLLSERMATADSLLSICNKRMTHGEATIMELNRIKIDRMNLVTELTENNGETERVKVTLQGMGTTTTLITNVSSDIWSANTEPFITKKQTEEGLTVSLANASLTAAQHELKSSKQAWLPKLTIGYRRNTELHEASNGPMVGLAMPIFSNSRKVKAAQLRQSAAEEELANAQHQLDNQRLTLQTEVTNLKKQLQTYDMPLMQQTLSTLLKAVAAGEVSISEYYTEADRIYTMLQNKITIQNKYNKLQAELNNL